MDRASAGPVTQLALGECPAAAAEPRVFRPRLFKLEQAHHAAAERLGPAPGEVLHHPQRQHEFDQQLGIQRLSARAIPLWRRAAIQRRLFQLQRDVTSTP